MRSVIEPWWTACWHRVERRSGGRTGSRWKSLRGAPPRSGSAPRRRAKTALAAGRRGTWRRVPVSARIQSRAASPGSPKIDAAERPERDARRPREARAIDEPGASRLLCRPDPRHRRGGRAGHEHGPTETAGQGQSAERRALAAVERGDVAELVRLAQTMRESAGKPTGATASTGASGRFEAPAVLSQPYPEACLARAHALGLEQVEFREQSPDSAARIRHFLEEYAWGASASTHELSRDGVAELRATFRALPAVEDGRPR